MLNSANLYQINTYVNNSDFPGEITGMLLYATIDEDMDFDYKIGNHRILVKTLNLNQDWDKISERLHEIADIIRLKH